MKNFFDTTEVDDAIREQTSPFANALQAIKRSLQWAGGFSLILNLLQLTIPIYMMQVLDRIMSSGNANSLYLLTFIAVSALAVSAVLDIVRSHVLNRAGSWMETRLSVDLFKRVALAYHRGRPQDAGGLEELWRLRSFMSSPAILALFDVPWMIFYLVILYMLAVPIGVIATVGGGILFLIAIRGEIAVRRQLEPSHSNTGRTRDYLRAVQTGGDELIAMGMLDSIQTRWVRLNVRALKGQYLSSGQASTNLAIFKFARLLLQLFVLFAGGLLVIAGDASVGVVIGASIIMSRALAPVEQAISSWKQALSSYGAYKNLKSVLSDPTMRQKTVQCPQQPVAVKLKDIAVTFQRQKEPFLKDISLDVSPGELLVVMGPSGSGKSLLGRLIAGAHQATGGFIHLGDYELRHFSRSEIGKFVGYVGQQSTFVPGTVTENLSRFSDIPLEAVVEAAHRTGAHDFIIELPDGYDTELQSGQGFRLSGGQQQRLALARAIVGHPGLLILDEPNLNLDRESEALLYQIVEEEKQRGTTQIVITHQQEMINRADKLAVIRNGQLEHFGPRNQVMRQLGHYVPRPAHLKRTPARMAVKPLESGRPASRPPSGTLGQRNPDAASLAGMVKRGMQDAPFSDKANMGAEEKTAPVKPETGKAPGFEKKDAGKKSEREG